MNALRLTGRKRVYCAFDDNDNILRGCVMMRSGGAARAAAEHCELLCVAARDCTIVYGVRLETRGKKHGRQGESVERCAAPSQSVPVQCAIQQMLIHAGLRTCARACAGWGRQREILSACECIAASRGLFYFWELGAPLGGGFAPGRIVPVLSVVSVQYVSTGESAGL